MEELRIGTEHEVGDAQNLAFIDCRSGWERASSGQPLAKNRLFATGRLHPAPVLQGQGRRNASDLYRARPNAGGSSRPIQKLWNEMLTYGHTTAEIILLFLRPRAT